MFCGKRQTSCFHCQKRSLGFLRAISTLGSRCPLPRNTAINMLYCDNWPFSGIGKYKQLKYWYNFVWHRLGRGAGREESARLTVKQIYNFGSFIANLIDRPHFKSIFDLRFSLNKAVVLLHAAAARRIGNRNTRKNCWDGELRIIASLRIFFPI